MTQQRMNPVRRRWPVALLAVAALLACGEEPGPITSYRPVTTSVALEPDSVILTAIGATAQLRANALDQNGRILRNARVFWASGNEPVATVGPAGRVTARGNGNTAITASAGGRKAVARVTVAQRAAAVRMSPPDTTLQGIGDTLRLLAEAIDANGHSVPGAAFTWTSGDESIVTVDARGVVTAVATGKTSVGATFSGVVQQVTVSVAEQATEIRVSPIPDTLRAIGATVKLSAESYGANGRRIHDAAFRWMSSVPSVAPVDETGFVIATRNGTTRIEATSGGAAASVVVTVDQRPVGIRILPGADTLETVVGQTLSLSALPIDANGHVATRDSLPALTWSSSDPSVLAVDVDGVATGLAKGVAVVTPASGALSGRALVAVHDTDTAVAVDRAALVALYRATNGSNWGYRKDWLTDRPLSEWAGVRTTDTGRVGRLWIPRNRLVGALPPEIGRLADLRILNLANDLIPAHAPFNSLRGPIPPEIGRLHRLEVLSLASIDLTGPVPRELASLANLRHLELHENDLTGPIPPELGGLTELRWLSLSSNDLAGPIPRELGALAGLVWLWLSLNDLTGSIPPELGTLADLEVLALGGNLLTGSIPPELGALAGLEILGLADNRLTGSVPPELGDLSSLEVLSLGGNTGLTGRLPRSLLRLTHLKRLNMDDTGLCAPRDTAFQRWLSQLEFSGESCRD